MHLKASQTENPETFENKLDSLEKIVKKLEEGSLTLQETLALYEKGMKMSSELNDALNEAEKHMREISNGKILPPEEEA